MASRPTPRGWPWRSPRPPATGWAGCTCGVSSAIADSPRWVLTICQLVCSTVQLAVICLAMSPRVPTAAPTTLAAVLVLGVLGTGLAYVLQHSIIRDAGATAASTVTYLIPVFAVLAGVVVLHETLGWNLAGAVLVLLGAALTQHRPKPKPMDRHITEARTSTRRRPRRTTPADQVRPATHPQPK